MYKKVMIFTLILLVLFMSANCGGNKKTLNGPFIGGSNGIIMSFKDTAPTSSFQEDDTVSVKVKLQNKGEFDIGINELNVKLFGLDLKNFNLENAAKYNTLKSDIKGANKEFFPEGGEKELDLGELKYKLQVIGESEKYTLRARACYPYKTKGQVNVCIKSQLAKESKEGVCAIEGEKIAVGDISSGPVQITSITQEYRGRNQVKFDIKIENKGIGKVYSIADNCQALDENSIQKLDSENKVKVTVLNPEGVKCGSEETNNAIVTLVPGTDKKTASPYYVLTCWKEATGSDVYETKLNVNLDYLYVSEISKELTIYSKA